MRLHKEYALKFLYYNLKKRQLFQNRTEQNRTEQNRTEQNRTEQNRTEHVALHNLNLLFILLRLVYHITKNLTT